MKRKATGDVWWKNAVIYCLDVETPTAMAVGTCLG
jgi:hypothetical protein